MMMSAINSGAEMDQVEAICQVLPRPGEHVIVQCRGFRCLGYFDFQGIWRHERTARELAGVQSWCRIGDDTFSAVF